MDLLGSVTMRVLITTSIFPPDIGGPATYVPTMARSLHDRGHSVSVVTTSNTPNSIDIDDGYPFEIVRISRKINRPKRAFELLRCIMELGKNSDLIFSNSISMPEPCIAATLIGKPLVLKVVGDSAWEIAFRRGWSSLEFEDFQHSRASWLSETLKRLRSFHAGKARLIIVPSRYLAGIVESWGVPPNRIRVIHNAVEPLDDVVTEAIPLDTAIKIAMVGRLVTWKNVIAVIETLAEIENVGLVIVGEGPEKPRLQDAVRELNLTKRVIFAGSLPKSRTMAILTACHIFVLNSTYEGLPHVVVEAMQAGMAIIATKVGGTPEVLANGKTGLLVPPNDRKSLREALETLILDPSLRQQLGQQAKMAVGKEFKLKTNVDKTEAALAQAL